MSNLKRDDSHPYLQIQNWSASPKQGQADLRFWVDNDMYSEETKRKLEKDFEDIEVDSKGYIKTKKNDR